SGSIGAPETLASSTAQASTGGDGEGPGGAGSKACPACGLTNVGSADACDCGFDFKTGTRPLFTEVAYATMSQRVVAYLADLIIVYLIVLSGYFVSGLLRKPLSSTEAAANVLIYLALFAYMTVAQVAYHTTVGKYVIGLKVTSATSESEY